MKEKKKPESVFIKKKISFKDISIEVYNLLEKIRFLVPFLNKLLKLYRLYYPGNSRECSAAAGKCLIKIYVVAALVFLVIFGFEPSFFSALIAFFLIYVFSMELILSSRLKIEVRFLKAFDNFLSSGRHYYYKYGSIKEALVQAELDSDDILKGHIREMIDCLSAPDSESVVMAYINSGYHKYLKLYLTLARLVEENGDITDENGSVFLNSCMRLKIDVEEDIRYIQDRKHRFSGLTLTAVLPALAIPFIGMWGVSTIESLNIFYNGYAGTLIRVVLLLISFVSYRALLRLKCGDLLEKNNHALAALFSKLPIIQSFTGILIKVFKKKAGREEERIKRLCEKYNIKTFYSLKIICFVCGFLISIVTLTIGHIESKKIYKYDVSEIPELTQLTDSRQITALEGLIPYYTEMLCNEENLPQKEWIKEKLLLDKDIKSEIAAEKASEEILNRVKLYHSEIFDLKDIFLCLLAGFIAFGFPGAALSFKKALIESKMQDEVMQFQSIIHMLKKIPGISTVALLEEMEMFSEIFRPAIKQCINEYNISDESALLRLYERERYPGLRRIVDCFLMADELGIEDAFEEISAEIENFTENRKLERRITLDSEGMLGAVIAVMPGGLILFGYLLCPFMIRSIQIFNEYQVGISMMG